MNPRVVAGIILIIVGVAAIAGTYFILLKPTPLLGNFIPPRNPNHGGTTTNNTPPTSLPNYTLSPSSIAKPVYNANFTDHFPIKFIPDDQTNENYSGPSSGGPWKLNADFQTSVCRAQACFFSDSQNGLTVGMNTENNPTREWVGDNHEENVSSLYAFGKAIPGARVFVMNLTFPAINNLSSYQHAGYAQEEVLGYRIISGYGSNQNFVIVHASYTPRGISFDIRAVAVLHGTSQMTVHFFSKPYQNTSHETRVVTYTDGKNILEVSANGMMIYKTSGPDILNFSSQPRIDLEMFTTIDYINITGSFSHLFAYSNPNMTITGLPNDSQLKVVNGLGTVLGVFNETNTGNGNNGGVVVVDLTQSPFGNTLYIITKEKVVGSGNFYVEISSSFVAAKSS
jgi:hypothetical protein